MKNKQKKIDETRDIKPVSEDAQGEEFVSPEGLEAAENNTPDGKKRRLFRRRKRKPLNLPKPVRAVVDFLKRCGRFFGDHPLFGIIVLSFVMNLFIETCQRHSIFAALTYLVTHPVIFSYNAIVILMTYSVSLLFKQKTIWITLMSIVWAGFGIANGAVLSTRVTPLTATDIKILDSGIQLMNLYLTKFQIALIGLAIVLAVAAMVFVSVKSKKKKVNYIKSGLIVLACIGLFFGSSAALIKLNVLETVFPNITDAYMEYGFVYCFYRGIFDSGVDKPQDYSAEAVKQILDDIEADSDNTPAEKPNIVIVQLESFFDVNRMKDYKYNENPIPTFTYLKEKYSSGYLTVPSIGAGTANTEFEVLTGMNIKYFGTGEYPFKTILQKSTCESVAYDLKELGYGTHAVHNHSGDFYSRHLVYANLGFDSFTSAEYIKDVVRNPLNWMKDSVLPNEVVKCLDSTEGEDFVFTVSVQGHGKYPSEQIDDTQTVTIDRGFDGTDEEKAGFEYYINQLREMDEFISDLVIELENRDEPTVLVLYGDHFPSLDIENEKLSSGNKFQTDYIIWSNFDMETAHDDINAYQLTSYVLGKFSINNGVLTKLHQSYSDNEKYQAALEMIEYDMLYGPKTIYNNENRYVATDIQYGIDKITLDDVNYAVQTDEIVLKGQNFTERSMVYIDDDRVSTDHIDENTLVVHNSDISPGTRVKVCQVTKSGKIMSETEEFKYDKLTRDPIAEAEGKYPVEKKPWEMLPQDQWPSAEEIAEYEREQSEREAAKTSYFTTTTTEKTDAPATTATTAATTAAAPAAAAD